MKMIENVYIQHRHHIIFISICSYHYVARTTLTQIALCASTSANTGTLVACFTDLLLSQRCGTIGHLMNCPVLPRVEIRLTPCVKRKTMIPSSDQIQQIRWCLAFVQYLSSCILTCLCTAKNIQKHCLQVPSDKSQTMYGFNLYAIELHDVTKHWSWSSDVT